MNRKKLSRVLFLAMFVMALAVPVRVKAKVVEQVISAGEIYYVIDSDITANAVTSNQFQVKPKTTNCNYDIIFSYGTVDSPQARSLVNYGTTLTSKETAVYIKNSANDNTGVLLMIRVRSGVASLKINSVNSAGTFTLDIKKMKTNQAPLKMTSVSKGKQINFQMNSGNLKYMPIIFCGTKGTKVKRTLSSSKYEIYYFDSDKLTRTTYSNGTKGTASSIKYNSKFKNSGKTYLCTYVSIPPSSTTKVSGWLKNTKGNAIFIYSKNFLGMKVAKK